jgi:hypothetical protein
MEPQNLPVAASQEVRRGDRFVLKHDTYLIENWRRILVLRDEDDYLQAEIRFVEVKDRIATLASKDLLIRTPLNLPDGFYELSADNHLVFHEKCEEERKSPNLRAMGFTENIDKQNIHRLRDWVQYCRSLDPERAGNATILIDERGFHYQRDPRVNHRIPTRADPEYAVVLPIPGEPIFVDAYHLMLALWEATRYDTVVIAYERSPDSITPLFIGRNWSQCTLVMPKPSYIPHSRTYGQYLR